VSYGREVIIAATALYYLICLLTFPFPSLHTFTHRAKTEDIFFDPEYRFPDMGPGTGLKRLESMVRTVGALLLSLCGGL
jgi:hypothetical protein